MIHWQAHSVPFYLSLAFYVLSAFGHGFGRRRGIRRVAEGAFVMAFLANTAEILIAWIQLGQPPFQTLYQSLVFFAWAVALTYLALRIILSLHSVGVAAAACAAGAMIYALIKADPRAGMLPPALRSPWFVPHVLAYFIGYGALFFSFTLALTALLTARGRRRATGGEILALMDGAIRWGFLLISVGLAIGLIWAESAWAAYWSWDPKENWALVTWLAYLAYLHLRRRPRWRGRAAAWLAMAGFLAVLFTYLGVHLLPTISGALHVYR